MAPFYPNCGAPFTPRRLCAMLTSVIVRKALLIAVCSLSACAGSGARPDAARATPPAEAQVQGLRELLLQAADQAVNRLGRPDGYWANPRWRIGLPDELARFEKALRHYGLERYADEFTLSMNRAAEAAMPAAKPVLLAAIRDLPLDDVTAGMRSGDTAATPYVRSHSERALSEQLQPIVAEATARAGVTASYKRFLKRVAVLDRFTDVGKPDLDAHITRAALQGFYLVLAEEEQHIRNEQRNRPTDFFKKIFR
jgi:hypothetical protein